MCARNFFQSAKVERGDRKVPAKTKKTRIKTEKNRLVALYADLPEDKKTLASGLIERAKISTIMLPGNTRRK